MNIPYTPIQCARKMLAFFVITMLAMLLIIMPATVYFASSDSYADTLFPLLMTTLLGSIIILIALFIENKREHLSLWGSTSRFNLNHLLLSLALGVVWGVAANVFKVGNVFHHVDLYFYLYIPVTVILGPIAEELLFRKWVVEMMKCAQAKSIFIVSVSAVLFFLLYVSQDNLRIDTLIMGAVLCVFYFKTNDIRYCIIVHSIANLIAVTAPYIKG